MSPDPKNPSQPRHIKEQRGVDDDELRKLHQEAESESVLDALSPAPSDDEREEN